jgi:hypothetical protein
LLATGMSGVHLVWIEFTFGVETVVSLLAYGNEAIPMR